MDECKTINVILQENGIIRDKTGNIIGRIATMDGLDFNALDTAGEMESDRNEAMVWRRLLWLNHGHTGMYGDDGEMQCQECLREYGFWDWKTISAAEVESKMTIANMKKFSEHINKVRG